MNFFLALIFDMQMFKAAKKRVSATINYKSWNYDGACPFLLSVCFLPKIRVSPSPKNSCLTRLKPSDADAAVNGTCLCTFLRVVMAELQPLKPLTINRPTKNKILPGKLTLADMVAAIFQLR